MLKPPRPRNATPEQARAYNRWWNATHPGAAAKSSRECRLRNLNRALVHAAKYRAKKRGLEFNLTYDDIVVPEFCPVLGIKLSVNIGEKKIKDTSPTIDRIDSTQGYVRGNVVVVSWRVNRIKNNSTIEELRKIADYYEVNQW
jgi:hypothetical protein